MPKSLRPLARLAPLAFAAALALPATAQETPVVRGVTQAPALGETINDPTFWGFGAGLVFTEIPISTSQFTVLMSDLHYGFYLTGPDDFVRTAATVGLYGFALVLPVPKAGIEMIIGRPTNDLQLKVGANGFYDITVGGHGGVAGEIGVRLKNTLDVSFMMVPAGTDSQRDYLEFVGVRDEPGNKPYVILPYYGIFVTFNY